MIKYLAGILDAEGYVRIRKSVPSKITGLSSYAPEVKIYMCYKPIVDEFAKLYGLTVKSDNRGLNRKVAYHVSIGSELLRTTTFIQDFLPYLNEKRLQLQAIDNLIKGIKTKEQCFQDYRIAKETFNHPIIGILDYEYIAGIIDGDGWFSMFKGCKAKDSIFNSIRFGLEQRYKPMIDYLAGLTASNVSMTKTKDVVNHKQTYVWNSGNPKILPILVNIEPFLLEKRKTCILMIEYIKKHEEFREYSRKTLLNYQIINQ